jgi:hypothetical protein
MPRRERKSNWSRPKDSTTARGYGSTHQAERRRWEPLVQAGVCTCVRCGYPILPGEPYHLDHRDDKLGYLGVSHARCNLLAAAQRGNAIKRALYAPRRQSREW